MIFKQIDGLKKKIQPIDFARPDKLLISGLKGLGYLGGELTNMIGRNLYSNLKSEAKGKGQITFIGTKKVEKVSAQIFEFDTKSCSEQTDLTSFPDFTTLNKSKKYWFNVHGLHDVDMIQSIQKAADIDRLSIRQLLDTTQRPKVEEYEHYLFFSIKSVLKTPTSEMNVEQLSFVLGNNHVISFQEEVGDHFDHIREKIREGIGFIRTRQPDYLLVQLLDAILDNYFETVDELNSEVAILEKVTLSNPDKETLLELEKTKKIAEIVKKSLSPFKEAITNILNRGSKFFNEENLKYANDLRTSCSNAIEEVDTTLRALESLTNIYFASLSHKMNETMKVLTTVATIFIPLTFIAGIYGMNFQYMPELQWRYGYFAIWGVMLVILAVMLIYFKRKKWL